MAAFKDPSFQERRAAAARAKTEALEKLRAKPPVDEQALAARTATRLAREAADAGKRAAARLAREEAAAAKRDRAKQETEAAQAEAAARQAALAAPVLTEAERKAARDARYAARKKRKS